MQLIEDRRSDEEAKLAEMKNNSYKALGRDEIEKAREKKKTTEERVEALFSQSSEMSAVAPKKPSGNTAPAENPTDNDTEMPEVSAKK